MKEGVGVLLRLGSAVAFFLGIIICLFSLKTGLLIVAAGVVFWNLSGWIVKPKSDTKVVTSENTHETIAEFNSSSIKEEKNKVLSVSDMVQFNNTGYNFNGSVVRWRDYNIVPLSGPNKSKALKDINELQSHVERARLVSNIRPELELKAEEMLFGPKTFDAGKPYERVEYYTYIKCTPYTKTGKISKYPFVLHYANQDPGNLEPDKNFFGDIHYMKDGNIGKARLIFWLGKSMYNITLGLIGATLFVKKVEYLKAGEVNIETIYKAN